jgi:flavodoxin I|tara:strand:+ start:187 stop:699 length:513 start_codon:yes stop_codon:yes gene_type:complete
MRIKLIYGTDTGNTELIKEDIVRLLDKEDIETINVADITPEDWNSHTYYILGIPTWYDGELQSDWESYFEEFKTIDFTGKKVAIFGLGDQLGYDEWFCDGVGILGKVVIKGGGKLIGYTQKDDSYDFETSLALADEETFYGLAIDEDNQQELTEGRLRKWVIQIKEEFNK